MAPNFYLDLFCVLIFYDIGHRLIPTCSSVYAYSSGERNAREWRAGGGIQRVVGDGVWWRFWAKRCRCCVSNAWLQKCVSLRSSLYDYLQYTCNLWNWWRIKQNGYISGVNFRGLRKNQTGSVTCIDRVVIWLFLQYVPTQIFTIIKCTCSVRYWSSYIG